MDGDRQAFLQANDFLWKENQRLRQELEHLHVEHQRLQADHLALQQRLAEVTRQSNPAAASAFIKPDALSKKRKPSGRKAGHAAALRPVPGHIDVHQDVPVDALGHPSCPK